MMQTKRCLVVDDEPIAREIVATYIRQIPQLSLLGQCRDAFEAMEALQQQPVDVLILDINMPKLSGLGMLRSLQSPPEVIITSAYAEYALEGFELSVTDYLLKPFSFERFVKAIGKTGRAQQPPVSVETAPRRAEGSVLLKVDQKLIRLNLTDIRYVEAYGNYVKVHTGQGFLLSRQTLSQLEAQLPGDAFIRIHKSYVVPFGSIEYVEGNMISVASTHLPLGKVYRNRVLEWLARGA